MPWAGLYLVRAPRRHTTHKHLSSAQSLQSWFLTLCIPVCRGPPGGSLGLFTRGPSDSVPWANPGVPLRRGVGFINSGAFTLFDSKFNVYGAWGVGIDLALLALVSLDCSISLLRRAQVWVSSIATLGRGGCAVLIQNRRQFIALIIK